MERKQRALLVGAEVQTEKRVSEVLGDWGWQTETCPGPSASRCPLMVAGRCDLREGADSAVVFVNPSHSGPSGSLPKLRCAADRSSPYVLVLEGSLTQAGERDGGRFIGSRCGAEAIAYTVVRDEIE